MYGLVFAEGSGVIAEGSKSWQGGSGLLVKVKMKRASVTELN